MTSVEVHNEGKAAAGEAIGGVEVLLVYEDLSTGLRAREAFERVARQLELEADFEVELWKFDLLREPALLELAANDAATADIVFLSAHGQGELPGTVHLWLGHWLERRVGAPCALVILTDTLAGAPATANQRLEGFCARAMAAGVDVFLHAAEESPTERQPVPDQIHPHAETRIALTDELLHSVELHPYRHWGINE
jgi:hypothetical protein